LSDKGRKITKGGRVTRVQETKGRSKGVRSWLREKNGRPRINSEREQRAAETQPTAQERRLSGAQRGASAYPEGRAECTSKSTGRNDRKAMGPMGTSMCNSCGGRGLRESICGLHHESVFRGGQKRVGECRYIRMCVAGLMGRDCGGGGACRAALQPQTHNFLSLQCTIGRGGGGRGVCRYTNVCCWGDGARLQRGRRVPSSAATSNPHNFLTARLW
jgi:hypothetical protein